MTGASRGAGTGHRARFRRARRQGLCHRPLAPGRRCAAARHGLCHGRGDHQGWRRGRRRAARPSRRCCRRGRSSPGSVRRNGGVDIHGQQTRPPLHDDLIKPEPFWQKAPELVDILDIGLRLRLYCELPCRAADGRAAAAA
ncbi:MAG: hypothetical protein WDN69_13915 [Aliidongia sp.]